ncbi:MAG: rRNA maturation RNase YbeY [Eubacterium sp.]|nr:rRNA maturation RNase YbeY [Eubacterium sp.]
MTSYITNEYSGDFPLSEAELEKIIRDVTEEAENYVSCPFSCTVEVTFVTDEVIREINRENREIDRATDVLSFPMLEYDTPGDFGFLDDKEAGYFEPDSGELVLGDIVISLDRALAQAAEYGHSVRREVAFLTAHSMLHLFGYDHEEENEREEMERMQEEILLRKGYSRE